jgi:hypothetical protein
MRGGYLPSRSSACTRRPSRTQNHGDQASEAGVSLVGQDVGTPVVAFNGTALLGRRYPHRRGEDAGRLPAMGDLTLDFKVMELVADPGLTFITLIAEPGSPSHDDLQLLSSWAATPENTEAAAAKETT